MKSNVRDRLPHEVSHWWKTLCIASMWTVVASAISTVTLRRNLPKVCDAHNAGCEYWQSARSLIIITIFIIWIIKPSHNTIIPPKKPLASKRRRLCTNIVPSKPEERKKNPNLYKESRLAQTSMSFFFSPAFCAPSTNFSRSPLISHMPRNILPSVVINSHGASYSISLPLSSTRTLS